MGTVYRSRTLESLFDRAVVAYEHCGESDADAIHEEEANALAKAVLPRRQSFIGGRLAAKSALETLGIEGWPVRVNADGAPIWPDGFVGSITHTEGFCAAIVASKFAYHGIGIDAERCSRVGSDLFDTILTSAELERIAFLPWSDRPGPATVMFSAKEAFFKCQYQVSGSWLNFDEVEIELGEGNFKLRLLQDAEPLNKEYVFGGRFAFLSDIIVTAIAITSDAF